MSKQNVVCSIRYILNLIAIWKVLKWLFQKTITNFNLFYTCYIICWFELYVTMIPVPLAKALNQCLGHNFNHLFLVVAIYNCFGNSWIEHVINISFRQIVMWKLVFGSDICRSQSCNFFKNPVKTADIIKATHFCNSCYSQVSFL